MKSVKVELTAYVLCDVDALSGLTSLTALELQGNDIESLTPLKGLAALPLLNVS